MSKKKDILDIIAGVTHSGKAATAAGAGVIATAPVPQAAAASTPAQAASILGVPSGGSKQSSSSKTPTSRWHAPSVGVYQPLKRDVGEPKHYRAQYRESEAKKVQATLAKRIADKYYEKKANGKIKTESKTSIVPRKQTSQEDIDQAAAALNTKLKEAVASGKVKTDKELANYQHTQARKIDHALFRKKVTEEPYVPKRKQEEYADAVLRARQKVTDVREGLHGEPKTPDIDSPKPSHHARWAAPAQAKYGKQLVKAIVKPEFGLEPAEAEAAKAVKKAGGSDAEARGVAKFVHDQNQPSFVGEAIQNVQHPMGAPTPGETALSLPPVNTIFEQLQRPLAASQSLFGHALAGGPAASFKLLDPEALKKMREAPGPADAFLHVTDPANTRGSDFSKAVGLPEQTGLLFDLAMDPLVYFRAMPLTVKTGEKSRATAEAIARVDKTLIDSPEIARLTAEATRSGDATRLQAHLDTLAKSRGIKIPRISRSQRRRWAKEDKDFQAAELRATGARIATRFENAPKLSNGRSVVLPGMEQQAAIAKVIQRSAKIEHRPGFRAGFGNPFNPYARGLGIDVPIPKWIAERHIVPIKLTHKAGWSHVEEGIHKNRQQAWHAEQLKPLDDTFVKLTQESAELRTKGDMAGANARMAEALDIQRKVDALNATPAPGLRNPYASLAEITNVRNIQRAVKEPNRMVGAQIKALESNLQNHVAHSLAPLKTDLSRLRVSLYLHHVHGTGGEALWNAKVGPLSPVERRAASDLRTTLDAMAQHGLEAGSLEGTVADYVTRVRQNSGEVMGTSLDEFEKEMRAKTSHGGGDAGTPAYRKQRRAYELASLASEEMLAKAYHQASGGRLGYTEATDLANQVFDMGRVRMPAEMLLRRLTRGRGAIPVDELTSAERTAIAYDERNPMRADGQTQFETVPLPEGNGFEVRLRGFDPADNVYTNLEPVQARLRMLNDAIYDRARIEEGLLNTSPESQLGRDYAAMFQRADEEVKALDVPAKDLAPPQPRTEALKTAKQKRAKARKDVKILTKAQKEAEAAIPKAERKVKREALKVQRANRGSSSKPDAHAKRIAESRAARDNIGAVRDAKLKLQGELANALRTALDNFNQAQQRAWAAKRKPVAETLREAKRDQVSKPPKGVVGRSTPIPNRKPAQGRAPITPPHVPQPLVEIRGRRYTVRQAQAMDEALAGQLDRLNDSYANAADEHATRLRERDNAIPIDENDVPLDTESEALATATAELAKTKEAAAILKRRVAAAKGRVTKTDKVVEDAQAAVDRAWPVPKETLEGWDHTFGTSTGVVKIAQPQWEAIARRNHASWDDPQLPGITSGWVQARKDPHLSDVWLNDSRANDNTFFEMDPRTAMFKRGRSEAVETGIIGRYRGIDEVYGVNDFEVARSGYATTRDGNLIRTGQLAPFYQRGQLVGWLERDSEHLYKYGELDFGGQFMPSMTNKVTGRVEAWMDPLTGREYRKPGDMDNPIGGKISDTVGQHRLWPTDVTQEMLLDMKRRGKTGYDQFFDTSTEQAFNKYLSMVRFGATTYFPAYHIRNMVTDALISLQAGPGVIFHPLMAYQMTKAALLRDSAGKITFPGLGRINAEEALFIMDQFGIRSNQHLAEYAQIGMTGKAPGATKQRLRWVNPGPQGALGGKALELSARREDIMRYVTMMQRFHKSGDIADAVTHSIQHHFDYNDLSAVEREKVRNAFLFYTWYRKNIPQQFAELIQRPGFFSAVGSTYNDLARGETPLNVDWSFIHPALPDLSGEVPMAESIPDYMRNQMGAVAVNWNGHAAAFGFGAPWVDLNMVTNFARDPKEAAQAVVSLLNPGITVPLQLIFKKDTLTGRDLAAFERVDPATAWIADKLGVPVLTREDGTPAIPWQASILSNQIPFWGRASNYTAGQVDPNADQGHLAQSKQLWSFLGVNAFVSPPIERREAMDEKNLDALLGERRAYADSIYASGLTGHDEEELLKKYDYEKFLPAATAKGLDLGYLQRHAEGTDIYITEEEKAKGKKKPDQVDITPESSGWGTGGSGFGDALGGGSGKSSRSKTTSNPRQNNQGSRNPDVGVLAARGLLAVQDAMHPNRNLLPDSAPKLVKQPPKPKAIQRKANTKLAAQFSQLNETYKDSSSLIAGASKEYNIDPTILAGIYQIETDFGANQNVSTAGAQGPMQFMPETFAAYGVKAPGGTGAPDIQDPADAIYSAANYLAANDGATDIDKALFAYNHADWYVDEVKANAQAFASPLWAKAGGADAAVAPSIVRPTVKKGEVIGTPYQGTHTLGNWQSDNAIDIAVPTGTKVVAARSGVVDKVTGNNNDPSSQFNGFQVTIGGNTFYTHLSSASVQAGDKVEAGDVIGKSGAANGVEHLHFGVAEGDPMKFYDAGRAGVADASTAPVPYKEMKKYVKFTEPKSEVSAEQRAPARTSLTKMQPEMQHALVQLAKNTGINVEINEGYRTEDRANDFDSGTGSHHFLGDAADVNNHDAYTSEDLAKVGLSATAVPGEPWHFQLIEPATSTSTSTAPSAGGYGLPSTGGTSVPPPPSDGSQRPERAPRGFLSQRMIDARKEEFAKIAEDTQAAQSSVDVTPFLPPQAAAEVDALTDDTQPFFG